MKFSEIKVLKKISNRENSIYVFNMPNDKLSKKIMKVINNSRDIQNRKTNVKAKMTYWDMEKKEGFYEFSKIVKEIVKYISDKFFSDTPDPTLKPCTHFDMML